MTTQYKIDICGPEPYGKVRYMRQHCYKKRDGRYWYTDGLFNELLFEPDGPDQMDQMGDPIQSDDNQPIYSNDKIKMIKIKYTKTVRIDENISYKSVPKSLQLWLSENSHDGDAMIIMFDISNFDDTMFKIIEQILKLNDKPKFLCGTHYDVVSQLKDNTFVNMLKKLNTLNIINNRNVFFDVIDPISNQGFERAITQLLRILTDNKHLSIIDDDE